MPWHVERRIDRMIEGISTPQIDDYLVNDTGVWIRPARGPKGTWIFEYEHNDLRFNFDALRTFNAADVSSSSASTSDVLGPQCTIFIWFRDLSRNLSNPEKLEIADNMITALKCFHLLPFADGPPVCDVDFSDGVRRFLNVDADADKQPKGSR